MRKKSLNGGEAFFVQSWLCGFSATDDLVAYGTSTVQYEKSSDCPLKNSQYRGQGSSTPVSSVAVTQRRQRDECEHTQQPKRHSATALARPKLQTGEYTFIVDCCCAISKVRGYLRDVATRSAWRIPTYWPGAVSSIEAASA